MLNKNEKYCVVDDWFAPSEYAVLKHYLTDQDLDWRYVPSTTTLDNSADKLLHYGFAKQLYPSDNPNSVLVNLLTHKLSTVFNIDSLLRIRAGLQLPVGKRIIHDPHVDFLEDHYTALFYFSTEIDAGHTYIYDKTASKDSKELLKSSDMNVLEKIEPRENRMLLFRGDVYHASSAPEKIFKRIAVNVNFRGTINEVLS